MVMTVDIGERKIGPGHPCFIIAEAGVNHNGDIGTARRLIDAAARAGADAVKFQSFKAEQLTTPEAPKAAYQLRSTSAAESQLDMLKALELSFESHAQLMDYCKDKGILFMSTPFDEESAGFLDSLGVEAFKMPSGEITNLPFLADVARKGKPMIVSTGMSFLGEVEAAVNTIQAEGLKEIVLLHCVSNYPSVPPDANLRAMETLRRAFGLPVGFSDHSLGTEIGVASVALGACVLEKHLTLDRDLPGPDHKASLEPGELTALIKAARAVEAALGDGRKVPVAAESDTAAVARKSLVAAVEIPSGTKLDKEMIAIKRPGTGLPPAFRNYLIGRTVRTTVSAGTLLTLEMLT